MQMILCVIGIIVIYFLMSKVIKSKFNSYQENEFQRGYNYAFSLYHQNVVSHETHSEVMQRIYDESELGYEFAGNDYYDKGMRQFYYEKLREGYEDVE